MNFSGNQLRAARALLGLDQETLAERVGVSDNTIRNMEACGSEPIGGVASTREKVRQALESQGIEFFNGDAPGVRLRKGATASKPPVGPRSPADKTGRRKTR
jgi:transcriptional regulator with XRE-family HTH domain